MDVLEDICTASQKLGVDFIWVDALCVDGRDREDRLWHLQRIHSIFRSAAYCIVLPTGFRELHRLFNGVYMFTGRSAHSLLEVVCPLPQKVLALHALTMSSTTVITDEDRAEWVYDEDKG
ncbi:hypothetical protein OH77DRAFT_1431268 [Trametes cingulata]|nr:hypothetical protein OH77DRAFT_1431268 [Trametes cingulata]